MKFNLGRGCARTEFSRICFETLFLSGVNSYIFRRNSFNDVFSAFTIVLSEVVL